MESSLDLLIQDIHDAIEPKESVDPAKEGISESERSKIHGRHSGLGAVWDKLDEQPPVAEPPQDRERRRGMEQIWRKLDF